jgi:hypothetical protein
VNEEKMMLVWGCLMWYGLSACLIAAGTGALDNVMGVLVRCSGMAVPVRRLELCWYRVACQRACLMLLCGLVRGCHGVG